MGNKLCSENNNSNQLYTQGNGLRPERRGSKEEGDIDKT